MSLITIGAADWKEYHGEVIPVKARLYANRDFKTSEGVFIKAGSDAKPHFYQDFNITYNGERIRVEAGDAYATTDSDQPNATYTLIAYDDTGALVDTLHTQLRISQEVNPTTWDEIDEFSKAAKSNSSTFPGLDALMALFHSIVNGAKSASSTRAGVVKLDVDPDDLANPVAVGINSPLLNPASPTPTGSGVTLANMYGNDLATAISEIGATPTTLVVDEDTTVSTFLVLPATLVLDQRNDAKINFTRTGQLAFQGLGVTNPMSLKPFFGMSLSTDLPNIEIFQWSQAQVNISTDTIDYGFPHTFITGQQVRYFPHPNWIGEVGGLHYSQAYYVIAVSANALKLASSYANAIGNIAIDLTSQGGAYGAIMRLPLAWVGADCPPKVSTELIDPGTNSISDRISILDGALSFHHGTIYCVAGRIITTFVQLGDYHSLLWGPGDHQNTFDAVTQFFGPFAMGSHTTFTSEPGAVIYESSVYGRTQIVTTKNGATDIRITGNHFKGNPGVFFNGGDAIAAIGNASNSTIDYNWFDGTHGYDVGVIENGYYLDVDHTFTNSDVTIGASKTWTATDVNTTTGIIHIVGHGFVTGTPFLAATVSALPSPLVAGPTYYIIRVDADNVKFAASSADAIAGIPITLASVGAGTSTVNVDSMIHIAGHGYRTTVPFKLTTTGTLPAPLVAGTTYYIIKIDDNTIKFASSLANAQLFTPVAIDLTTTGDGATKTIDVDGVTGQNNYTAKYNVIDHNLITGYITQLLFVISGQNLRITNNIINIDFDPTGTNCSLMDFEPNTQFDKIEDVEVSGNIIYARGISAITRGIVLQSIYTEGTKRVQIHDNYFNFSNGDTITNAADGIAIYPGASDIDVYDNEVVGSPFDMFSAGPGRRINVKNNRFKKNARGIGRMFSYSGRRLDGSK
jgi:hypothetical protein